MRYFLLLLVPVLAVAGYAAAETLGFSTLQVPSPWLFGSTGLFIRELPTAGTSTLAVVIGSAATTTFGNRLEVNGNAYISSALQVGTFIATGTPSGFATSGPGALFSVQGPGLITGPFTTGFLVATSAPQFKSLASCDTIDTDASGLLSCGTDATGALTGGNANALTYWTSGTAVAATSSPTIQALFASSTTRSSLAGGLELGRAGLGISTGTPGAMLSVSGEGLFAGRLLAGVLSATSTLEVGKDVLTDITGNQLTISAGALGVSEGAGSGLDADTLDTIDSLSFLRSDATDSYTSGTLTFDAGTSAIFSGSFGFATTSPAAGILSIGAPLLVKGTTTSMGGLLTPSVSATGTLGFYTGGALAPRMYIDSSGQIGLASSSPGFPVSIAATTTLSAQIASNIASTSANPDAQVIVDWSNGNTRRFIISQNTTLIINATSSGPLDGGKYILKACQNHIGGFTLAVNSDTIREATTSAGASLSWVSTKPNTCTFIGMQYDADYGAGHGIYTFLATSTGLLSR